MTLLLLTTGRACWAACHHSCGKSYTLYIWTYFPLDLWLCVFLFLKRETYSHMIREEPNAGLKAHVPLTRIRSGQENANVSGTMRATLENVRVLYFATNCTEPYVQIITVQDSKRRQSVCSSEGSEVGESDDDLLPVLCDHSHLLDDQHLERIAVHMPARTKGYKWQLAYSTVVHGTSLKTLYRNMSGLDKPVMLVVKDMQNKVFGAFSTEPFRVSGSCYGTGETFLYSFSPDFKVYRWTGENSYFVRGHLDSLQIGGGGGGFGLWLDADLHRGASHSCPTFHNPPLSTQQDFLVQDLEVWTLRN
ncbi:nuclear receptor coactivator 7 isoform X1 [Gadus morhua]|nr:nuclear receptor coactivator 7-like isoform X1 [Gadus morhua]